MGTKFSPSLGNLFMARWKEDMIYARDWLVLTFYRSYIDNIFSENFIGTLNNNSLNKKQSHSFSQVEINFLDLSLMNTGSGITTKTFFKLTVNNGYIPCG